MASQFLTATLVKTGLKAGADANGLMATTASGCTSTLWTN